MVRNLPATGRIDDRPLEAGKRCRRRPRRSFCAAVRYILWRGALVFALTGCSAAPGVGADGGEPMQVTFQSEGGIAQFPGLSRPVTIDSGELPDAQKAELRQLVEAADFFDRPAEVGKPARGAADYRQYTITIDAGERKHTLRLVEPVSDPALQRLVRFLQDKAKAMRTGARPGGSP